MWLFPKTDQLVTRFWLKLYQPQVSCTKKKKKQKQISEYACMVIFIDKFFLWFIQCSRYDTKLSDGPRTYGNVVYSFIAIAPRSTLTQSQSELIGQVELFDI